jgi:hypothetical protein
MDRIFHLSIAIAKNDGNMVRHAYLVLNAIFFVCEISWYARNYLWQEAQFR